MAQPQEVTTFCPRCGRPILWSVRPFDGGEALEVSSFACHCALSEEEWDDLTDQVGEAGDDAGDVAPNEGDIRRVREDDPA